MRSFSRNNRKRARSKKERVHQFGEGTFYALQFAKYIEEIKDSSEVLTVNPNIIFSPNTNTVIFDYSTIQYLSHS